MRNDDNKRFCRLPNLLGLGLALSFSLLSPSVEADDGDGGGDLVTQLLQRVTSLEASQRELRGEIDQVSNQVKTQTEALTKKLDDSQFNAGIGKNATSERMSGSASSQKNADSTRAFSPADLVQQGKAALSARNFDVSQAKAQAAIKSARDTKTKVDARFLLAQSLAGQKNYKGSALAYFDAYKAAPRAMSAQESLLGVSASMLALNHRADACEALGKLKRDFPDMSPRIRKAFNSFFRRAHCG